MSAKSILIVDDDQGIVQLLTEALTYEQFLVFAASNGRQALELVEQQPIDLIVMDIMMPEMDGLEAIRQLRRKFHMPIILLSARDRASLAGIPCIAGVSKIAYATATVFRLQWRHGRQRITVSASPSYAQDRARQSGDPRCSDRCVRRAAVARGVRSVEFVGRSWPVDR